jgi:LysM repeat protein
VADERGPTPAPRPRRRRTDIDPNAPSPPVANERRRRRSAATPPTVPQPDAALEAGPGPTAPAGPSWPTADTADPTITFHVPGLGGERAAEAASSAAAAGAAGMATAATQPTVEPDLPPGDDWLIGDTPTPNADGTSWLQVLDDRSPDPNVCPFLRAAGGQGLVAPIEMPHPANRCAALAEAVPQSLRQQELVCLTTGHVNCPRYLRGTAVAVDEPAPVVRPGRALTPAVLGSLFVLVMAVSASIAFVLARGGPSLAGLVPAASPSAVAIDSPLAGESLAPSATAGAGSPSSPSSSASASLSPSSSATPSSSPTPRRTAAPSPTSSRFALLRACPGTPNCWIYTIRRGDNLYSIARYFGVSLDSIYQRNPWVKTSGLRAGRELRIPTPTR